MLQLNYKIAGVISMIGQEQAYERTITAAAEEKAVSSTLHTEMAKVYNRYFGTGFYNQRYPEANKRTLNFIQEALHRLKKDSRHILDFGCGSGRYLFPLLESAQNRFTAYDISEKPLQLLSQRLILQGNADRVSILHGDLEMLTGHISKSGSPDLILLMFGVLSHVGDHADRLKVLRRLKSFLADGSSRIILSVPNHYRRFKKITKGAAKNSNKAGDIFYSRQHDGKELKFFYHLYTPLSLEAELNEAGLFVHRMCAESYFPESWVTGSALAGGCDRTLCRIIPPSQGYGILAEVGLGKPE